MRLLWRAREDRRGWKVGFQHVCSMSATLMLASRCKTKKNIRNGTRASFNRSRATHNENCKSCILLFPPDPGAAPPGLQPGLGLDFQDVFLVVFLASLPSHPSLERTRSSSSAPATALRFTGLDSPDTGEDIAAYFCSSGAGSSASSTTTGSWASPTPSSTSHLCACKRS